MKALWAATSPFLILVACSYFDVNKGCRTIGIWILFEAVIVVELRVKALVVGAVHFLILMMVDDYGVNVA